MTGGTATLIGGSGSASNNFTITGPASITVTGPGTLSLITDRTESETTAGGIINLNGPITGTVSNITNLDLLDNRSNQGVVQSEQAGPGAGKVTVQWTDGLLAVYYTSNGSYAPGDSLAYSVGYNVQSYQVDTNNNELFVLSTYESVDALWAYNSSGPAADPNYWGGGYLPNVESYQVDQYTGELFYQTTGENIAALWAVAPGGSANSYNNASDRDTRYWGGGYLPNVESYQVDQYTDELFYQTTYENIAALWAVAPGGSANSYNNASDRDTRYWGGGYLSNVESYQVDQYTGELFYQTTGENIAALWAVAPGGSANGYNNTSDRDTRYWGGGSCQTWSRI